MAQQPLSCIFLSCHRLLQRHLKIPFTPPFTSHLISRSPEYLFLERYFSTTSTSLSLKLRSSNNNNASQSPISDDGTFSDWSSKVFYQDDNFLAINKSLGQSVFGDSQKSSSLIRTLPRLSHDLKIPDLELGISLKSFYSGLVLLTKHKQSQEKLKKVLQTCNVQKISHLTFLAITVGKPTCNMNQQELIYLSRGRIHKREMTTVAKGSNMTARKAGLMNQVAFSVRIISTNEETSSSLVEISVNKDKWEIVQVILSHYLSPVVGDTIYSSRTTYLKNIPVPNDPLLASPGSQRLPDNLEEALSKQFDLKQSPPPLFVHRSQITLPKYPYKSSPPWQLTAPLPSYFKKALDCLGLQEEEE